MMQSTGRRTVPQIFIGDTHVGGCDDLMALDAKGGLLPLLQRLIPVACPCPARPPLHNARHARCAASAPAGFFV
jgi:hypothetical protein